MNQMVRTDVSYMQDPKDMPEVTYAHHDSFTTLEFDAGLMMFVTADQLVHLYERLGDAIQTRNAYEEQKSHDYAAFRRER